MSAEINTSVVCPLIIQVPYKQSIVQPSMWTNVAKQNTHAHITSCIFITIENL